MNAASPGRARVVGHEVTLLDAAWEAASTAPAPLDAGPSAPPDGLDWLPARVPGTAAGVLRDAARTWTGDLDAEDWWFRTRFEAEAARLGEEVVLHLDGIATVAEVYLNGELILSSESMFARHDVDVGASLRASNVLLIRCRALGPRFSVPRRPRARWRTRLVSDGSLRWFRTMLIGRAPGFAPGPAAVGPWRPIWLERRRGLAVEAISLRPRLAGDDGVLTVSARLRGFGGPLPDHVDARLDGPSGEHVIALDVARGADHIIASGELGVPAVSRWWPHTHGEPALHRVELAVQMGPAVMMVDAGRVGFRTLSAGPEPAHDVERDGIDLHVNGERVFCRGAVWTPVDPVGLAPTEDELRRALEAVRLAGMNMLRVPGIGAYEDPAFHDLCDELGILVWQDFMFANLDYPFADEAFRSMVELEAAAVLDELAGRPSLAVLCGNSEIEQQVAMLGLDGGIGRDEFFRETLPALMAAAECDAAWVPSAPSGGALPFRTDRGVANYFGVGAYLRPLADARAAGVRFAAECLALANVPDEDLLESIVPDLTGDLFDDPRWKAGVPRDAGAEWDFDDVRDHYLALLYGVDPAGLRMSDPDRYLELSRAVSGEVMAEVFGEWRRSASPCGGGLILWLRDLVAGAGWGVIDERGEPKAAWYSLRRALAPIAVWTTDDGLNGIGVHVANDGPIEMTGRLRIGLYHDHAQRVGGGVEEVVVPPHGQLTRDTEAIVGRFVDASYAYRFGPPAQDLIVASLERDSGGATEILSQAIRFPSGRPSSRLPAERIGLTAERPRIGSAGIGLTISSDRLSYGVRVHVAGFRPSDDSFAIEPGGSHNILLVPTRPGAVYQGGTLTALNLDGHVSLPRTAAVAVGD